VEMKDIENIQDKIAALEERLAIVESQIEMEVNTRYYERDIIRCRFLDLQKKIYSFAIAELKWVLDA